MSEANEGRKAEWGLIFLGVFLLLVPLIIAAWPQVYQNVQIYLRIIAALGGGLIAGFIPGALGFDFPGVKAVGALGVFALVYVTNPPEYVASSMSSAKPGTVPLTTPDKGPPTTPSKGKPLPNTTDPSAMREQPSKASQPAMPPKTNWFEEAKEAEACRNKFPIHETKTNDSYEVVVAWVQGSEAAHQLLGDLRSNYTHFGFALWKIGTTDGYSITVGVGLTHDFADCLHKVVKGYGLKEAVFWQWHKFDRANRDQDFPIQVSD